MTGRGAWPEDGSGGTLNVRGDGPGPYYVVASSGGRGVGSLAGAGGGALFGAGLRNAKAVRGGVVAIQKALNRRMVDKIQVSGIFDVPTGLLVSAFQRSQMVGQKPWGGVGPDTARALFMPDVVRRSKAAGFGEFNVVCGVMKVESVFDPGAIGKADDRDVGLAQINGPSHPELSFAQRLQAYTAIDFVVGYLKNALDEFGNMDDAIASYNLGLGGASDWVDDGRPATWTPPGSKVARDVAGYIHKIRTACVEA